MPSTGKDVDGNDVDEDNSRSVSETSSSAPATPVSVRKPGPASKTGRKPSTNSLKSVKPIRQHPKTDDDTETEDDEIDDDETEDEDDSQSGSNDGKWACFVCTFHNSMTDFKCRVCDAKKGPSTRKPRRTPSLADLQQIKKQQEQLLKQSQRSQKKPTATSVNTIHDKGQPPSPVPSLGAASTSSDATNHTHTSSASIGHKRRNSDGDVALPSPPATPGPSKMGLKKESSSVVKKDKVKKSPDDESIDETPKVKKIKPSKNGQDDEQPPKPKKTPKSKDGVKSPKVSPKKSPCMVTVNNVTVAIVEIKTIRNKKKPTTPKKPKKEEDGDKPPTDGQEVVKKVKKVPLNKDGSPKEKKAKPPKDPSMVKPKMPKDPSLVKAKTPKDPSLVKVKVPKDPSMIKAKSPKKKDRVDGDGQPIPEKPKVPKVKKVAQSEGQPVNIIDNPVATPTATVNGAAITTPPTMSNGSSKDVSNGHPPSLPVLLPKPQPSPEAPKTNGSTNLGDHPPSMTIAST